MGDSIATTGAFAPVVWGLRLGRLRASWAAATQAHPTNMHRITRRRCDPRNDMARTLPISLHEANRSRVSHATKASARWLAYQGGQHAAVRLRRRALPARC